MSEIDIHQILRLNYKKLQEWWTGGVDRDCISFNLYRITENSLFLQRMEKIFQEKNSTAKFINNVFI